MNDLLIPFSDYDRFLYNLNQCGDLLVFSLAIIESNDSIVLDKQLVKHVMDYMIKRHPMLRANLNFDENIHFRINNEENVFLTENDLIWIKLKHKDEFESKLEELTKIKLDYSNKLWRVVIFEFNQDNKLKYGITLWLPLIITDALNITALIIEMVNILNSLINKTTCIEMSQSLELIDNIFKYTQNLIGEKQIKKIDEINNVQTSSFKFDPKFKNETERGCKIKFFNFDKEQSQKLISLSKQHGVKFTAFVMTCFNYAIQQLYRENNLPDPKNIKFGLASNIRFRLKPVLDFSNIGYFSCLIPINTVYPNFGCYDNFWRDAKYLDEIIKENTSVETGSIFSDSHNLKATKEVNELFEKVKKIEQFCSIMGNGSKWDVMMSNAGTYLCKFKNQNPLKPFRINEMYFTDTQNSYPVLDHSILMHLITWNEQLMFMISSNKAGISSCSIERLLDIFKTFILNSSKL